MAQLLVRRSAQTAVKRPPLSALKQHKKANFLAADQAHLNGKIKVPSTTVATSRGTRTSTPFVSTRSMESWTDTTAAAAAWSFSSGSTSPSSSSTGSASPPAPDSDISATATTVDEDEENQSENMKNGTNKGLSLQAKEDTLKLLHAAKLGLNAAAWYKGSLKQRSHKTMLSNAELKIGYSFPKMPWNQGEEILKRIFRGLRRKRGSSTHPCLATWGDHLNSIRRWPNEYLKYGRVEAARHLQAEGVAIERDLKGQMQALEQAQQSQAAGMEHGAGKGAAAWLPEQGGKPEGYLKLLEHFQVFGDAQNLPDFRVSRNKPTMLDAGKVRSWHLVGKSRQSEEHQMHDSRGGYGRSGYGPPGLNTFRPGGFYQSNYSRSLGSNDRSQGPNFYHNVEERSFCRGFHDRGHGSSAFGGGGNNGERRSY
ncbi:unnamed protein product [Amoebophrya sp. A25]|nr:unnamed protein product [Amoebophrya sp. A25]|eukprot:GSA25T00019541001.1